MSKYIAVIPRAAITRAALVEAGGRSMEQVKAACGCQYILNSWFYDTITGRTVGNLKIDGTVKAAAGWNGWGLTWDKGADIRLDILPDNGGASYLSGVELLTPTRGPGKALSYSPEYGSTRGRSAVLLAGARVILYCSGDGTADAKTPEGLRDELVTIGCRYDQAANLRALGLDAGSSSNCDFGDGQRISNGKRVKGYLCIWTTEDGTEEPPEKEESMGKYKVTPSIGVNIRSGPGTGYGKVGAYPCGAVVDVLEERDGWGRTRIRAGCLWPIWRPWRALSGSQTTALPSRRTLSTKRRIIGPEAAIPASTSPSMRPATRPRVPMPWPTPPIWTATPGSAIW